jgi:hypothetical protein
MFLKISAGKNNLVEKTNIKLLLFLPNITQENIENVSMFCLDREIFTYIRGKLISSFKTMIGKHRKFPFEVLLCDG